MHEMPPREIPATQLVLMPPGRHQGRLPRNIIVGKQPHRMFQRFDQAGRSLSADPSDELFGLLFAGR